MRPGWKSLLGATLVAPGLLVLILARPSGAGDEPGRFGRFFRFGAGSSSPPGTPTPSRSPNSSITVTPPTPAPSIPATSTAVPEVPTPADPGPSATPRIVPRPRVSRPVTESDPIVTRITLNRSDDGNSFGMFLQVFADGTVIDGEGVHHVGQDALKPLVEALQSGELYRLKGHCGAPATDYIESVHVVVYERSLGRLRANAFSYSGNPQGCDDSVRNLHATLDNLQAKITRPLPAGTTPGVVTSPEPVPPIESPTVIPLTPGE